MMRDLDRGSFVFLFLHGVKGENLCGKARYMGGHRDIYDGLRYDCTYTRDDLYLL